MSHLIKIASRGADELITQSFGAPMPESALVAAIARRELRKMQEAGMALDQQETFNQLVRQNNAYRECLDRLRIWLTPGRQEDLSLASKGRMDMLDDVHAALKTQ